MRVALVCHRYPPYPGGLERHVSDLAKGLLKRRIDVRVFTTSATRPRVGPEQVIEMSALQLPAGGYYFWPGFMSPGVLRQLEDVDVVHSFSAAMFAPVAALTWAHLKEIPSVLTAIFHPMEFTPHIMGRALYDRLVLPNVVQPYDRVILQCEVESLALKNSITRLENSRVRRVEHSSAILEINESPLGLRERVGRPNAKFILCVGRIDYFKGFDDVVKAGMILRNRGLDVTVVHVGPREGWFTGSSMVETASKELVIELGPVSEPLLASAYRECDVTVIPSKFESFGLVSVESLLLGTPVISTPTGIMPEIISDGVNGSTYEAGNVEELADKIERTLATQNPTSTCRKPPLISVEKFGNPAREIDDILRVYSELM